MPACELCRREVDGISKHFLMPRMRHPQQKNKKDATRDGVKGRPVDLCRPCHKQIHGLTNKEAEQYF
jgi:hypothetical protein